MTIGRKRTDNLAKSHGYITRIDQDVQELALQAEDALASLEDREARRAMTRSGSRFQFPTLIWSGERQA